MWERLSPPTQFRVDYNSENFDITSNSFTDENSKNFEVEYVNDYSSRSRSPSYHSAQIESNNDYPTREVSPNPQDQRSNNTHQPPNRPPNNSSRAIQLSEHRMTEDRTEDFQHELFQ